MDQIIPGTLVYVVDYAVKGEVRATLAQARRRRERRGLLLWLVTITVMMALAVALGVYLHAFELLATSIETTTGV